MGLVHTPRTLVAIGKGLMGRGAANASQIGFGATPHIYSSRAGLLDLDYLGHMNNAAYLTHAELARWQMTAQNGMLQKGFKKKCFFVVTSNTIRYRKEIRFGKFSIETRFVGFDDRNFWGIHNFYAGDQRVRAQVIVKAAVLQGKSVIKPKDFLTDVLELDNDTIDFQERFSGDQSFKEMVQTYDLLEESMRLAAARDDERLR
jgi:acyl-CoA thioesterase FadM